MNYRTENTLRLKDAAEDRRFLQYGPPPLNPFRELRQQYHLTLQDVYERALVSKQALIRLEQGTFDEPLPSVLDWFVKTYPLSELQLCDRYADYQQQQRARYHHLFGPNLHVPNTLIHPLRYLRDSISFSVTEVSKALCVPQSALDRFEKRYRSQKSVPRNLSTALLGAGYTGKDINSFHEAYQKFRNQATIKVKI